MKAADTFAERQKGANIGEELFEKYCISKNVRFSRLGFQEKSNEIPNYWQINGYLRNLPDYLVITSTRNFLVMVKGTANMKKTEVQMIPQFLEWYGSKDCSLYYAFCFEGRNTPYFRTPDQVIELYKQGQDKQWTDGKIYRTLQLE
jgi:hypothetical protein